MPAGLRIQLRLHCAKQFLFNYRSVLAIVYLIFVTDHAEINRIAEQMEQGAAIEWLASHWLTLKRCPALGKKERGGACSAYLQSLS